MEKFSNVFIDATKEGKKIPKEQYLSIGKYPIIDQGQNEIAGYTNDNAGLYEDIPAIIFGDHTRVIKFVDKPFFLGADGVKLLKAKNRTANYKYLYYALSNIKIPNTGYNRHFKWLKEVKIKLYSKEIQENIVSVLDKVMNLIDKRKQQLEKLDELVKSRFVEMFGNTEFNTKNFPVCKLEKLCKVGSSKRIYQSEQSNDGVPFLRISNLNERIDTGNETCELYIPIEKYKELVSLGLVPMKDDILVTSRGTLGKCYIVRENDKFYFQDGMISWISAIDKKISSIYISYLFLMTGVQKQISSLQAGSTVAYLSIAMLKKLDIIVPPIELQNQFADFVEQVNKSKAEIQKGLEKLELLKKALMQKYFE